MKRQIVARKIEGGPQRKTFSPSHSTAEMLSAFEDKLAEFGIQSSTEVKASTDEVRNFVDEMAHDDFEAGSIFSRDDYREFEQISKESGYSVSEADFDYYFDCVDGYREDSYSDDVEGCNDIQADTSDFDLDEHMRKEREVEIYGEDPNERYEDVGGGFGDIGEIISLAEMKEYWNKMNIGDPVLENYSNFNDWFRDTRDNFLQEA